MRSTATHYTITDVTTRTGFSSRDVLVLEQLGVFPSSACHHDRGRFWLSGEIDDFTRFLDGPGIRDWIAALLVDGPVRP